MATVSIVSGPMGEWFIKEETCWIRAAHKTAVKQKDRREQEKNTSPKAMMPGSLLHLPKSPPLTKQVHQQNTHELRG